MVIVRFVMVALALAALVLDGSLVSAADAHPATRADALAEVGGAVRQGSVLAAAMAGAGVDDLRLSSESADAQRVLPVRAMDRSGSSITWEWPVRPAPPVLRGFQVGPARWSPGHRGVDLGATAGQPIRAPANGTVTFAGMVAGRPVISIDHGQGLVSSLEPVAASVQRGQAVAAGSPIGTLWPSRGHCSPRTCVHWGVRVDGRYIDPLRLLGRPIGPMILLPNDSLLSS